MTPKPKTDEEIKDLFVDLYGEPNDRSLGEFERSLDQFIEIYRQAESSLLPIIEQKDERIRELENRIALLEFRDDEPYMGRCDVDGCETESSANGIYYGDTGYWLLCPEHSKLARDGAPQPKMKQSSIERENSRDKETGFLPILSEAKKGGE